jgi:hypothetical protein
MKRDDALWKGLIEDLADDFLKFFFQNAEETFDLNRKISFLDKELEQLFPNNQDDFNPKYVDKLLKVYTKSGKEEWVLVHIEVRLYNQWVKVLSFFILFSSPYSLSFF